MRLLGSIPAKDDSRPKRSLPRLLLKGLVLAALGFLSLPLLRLAVRTIESALANQRRGEVKEELKCLGQHPWAGHYRYGDGLGVNVALTLAPKSGWVYTWYGCEGLYSYNYGAVEFQDGQVKLHFAKADDDRIPHTYYLVQWGSRHYLIPPEQVIEFCNAVNAGIESGASSRSARFLLRDDAVVGNLEVQPEVPAQFRPYLLLVPLECRVVSVEQTSLKSLPHSEHKTRVTRVRLDIGEAEGALPGMRFHAQEGPEWALQPRITAVEQHSSTAEIEQFGDSPSKCKPGLRLTTGPRPRSAPPAKPH